MGFWVPGWATGDKVQDGKVIAFLVSKLTEFPIFLASRLFSATMLNPIKSENNTKIVDFFNIFVKLIA